MDNEEILKRLEEQERKIDEIYRTFAKIKKYVTIFVIISILAFILPLIGLIFIIPSFLSNYSSLLNI